MGFQRDESLWRWFGGRASKVLKLQRIPPLAVWPVAFGAVVFPAGVAVLVARAVLLFAGAEVGVPARGLLRFQLLELLLALLVDAGGTVVREPLDDGPPFAHGGDRLEVNHARAVGGAAGADVLLFAVHSHPAPQMPGNERRDGDALQHRLGNLVAHRVHETALYAELRQYAVQRAGLVPAVAAALLESLLGRVV